ncbi:transcriptional regulator [Maricaulis sp.]|uniref:winged helix-turn-helix domain-containing protein n=1 Tax=Maricaulis sp. TaxID=1486257 RepID=UPI00262747A1|nr:transcriptional regulator [Maricaulis sp.]
MTSASPILAAVLQADRVIHEPVRLCVLTLLASVESADFVYLQRMMALTGGNLSTHIGKLSEAGLIEVEKGYAENRPRTTLSLTDSGREALQAHAKALVALVGPLAK